MAFRHVFSVGTVAKAVTDKSANRAFKAMVYSVAAKKATAKAKTKTTAKASKAKA